MADTVKPVGIRVFVYGSLKAGRANNDVLRNAEYIGRCKITGRYNMLNLKWYPGLVEDPDVKDRSIVGEVYRVPKDTLDALDMIEGHPDFYTRHKVTTPWKGAWCYFLPYTYKEQCPEVMPALDNTQIWQASEEEIEWAKQQQQTN